MPIGSSPDIALAQMPARKALLAYRQETNFLRQLQQPAPATRILLIAFGAVFAVGYLLTVLYIEPQFGEVSEAVYPMVLFGAKINSQVHQGAWWRLVTNTLLHGGVLHLAFNAYALFFLGTVVERMLGTPRFIVIYGLAGLAGALASLTFNEMASVGASGAIFGVFGAAVVFGAKHRAVLPPRVAHALTKGLLPYLLLSLGLGMLPMVDNAAHMGGLTAGCLAAALMSTPLRGASRPWAAWLTTALAGLLLVVALVAVVSGVWFAHSCLVSSEAWEACTAIGLRGP